MCICKRCGADDLLKTDLCGDYGCVYCYGTPESELKTRYNPNSYTILAVEKVCKKCKRKAYIVKETGTCEKCFFERKTM